MHSYQHNIKTFNHATRHLTRVERSVYRDAIELYYDAEQPLPADDFDRLARRLLCFSDEEKSALTYILDEFFTLTGDVYTHDYCDEQVENYHNMTSAKARAGKASAEARKKKAEQRKKKRSQSLDEQNKTDDGQQLNTCSSGDANHKPETINHNNNPETSDEENKKKKKTSAIRLQTYLDQLKNNGEKPFPETDPIHDYCSKVNLPGEYLKLCWLEFVSRYRDRDKRYKDWRAVFRRCVKENWFDLWWINEGEFMLKNKGQQAMLDHKGKL